MQTALFSFFKISLYFIAAAGAPAKVSGMNYILYKGNCYTKLRINFSPKLNGSDFFKILELVEFPVKEGESVLLKYAITELVTNSIRALHEKKSDKEVVVEFQTAGNFIRFVVTDFAGGFDLSKLPIDINRDNAHIDILSREFQEYRERHGFNRFGIGLCSSRMALDAFHLVFIDGEGNELPWRGEGSVRGTRITAAKRVQEPEAGLPAAAVIRRNRRHSIFSKATINNLIESYLIDISTQGVRLLCLEQNDFVKGDVVKIQIGNGDVDGLSFRACVRWITKEGIFWQLGAEFVLDASFPEEAVKTFVHKIENDPSVLSGLVVIEGS